MPGGQTCLPPPQTDPAGAHLLRCAPHHPRLPGSPRHARSSRRCINGTTGGELGSPASGGCCLRCLRWRPLFGWPSGLEGLCSSTSFGRLRAPFLLAGGQRVGGGGTVRAIAWGRPILRARASLEVIADESDSRRDAAHGRGVNCCRELVPERFHTHAVLRIPGYRLSHSCTHSRMVSAMSSISARIS